MSGFDRKKIDSELRRFTNRNFERPSNCKNLEQIRFYVSELSRRIADLEGTCSYVPSWAYTLLSQYNERQNAIINMNFRKTYC